MDCDLYSSVLEYYKCFCTKTSDIKNYFTEESSFFLVGESGQTSIAYGKEAIERLIEEQFWGTEVSRFGNTLIAFNINIEKKDLVLCPKTTNNEQSVTEMAVVVVANLKGVHTEKDIKVTKHLGQRFVQTFLIHSNANETIIKSTFFSYLVPTLGLLNANIRTKTIEAKANEYNDKQNKVNDSIDSSEELDFQQIVDNIDKLIDESSCSDDSEFVLSPTKIEANRNELMPISVDEVFEDEDNSFDDPIRCEQYLNEVWTQTIKSNEKVIDNEKELECNREAFDSQNNGTSFADVLRDNLQSFQRPKTEERASDIRIIATCGKPKYKTGGDRRYDFCGQQNITIMGAQNLEDFPDNQIVFVANIPIGYSKTDFKRNFETFGKVSSIKFVERIGVFFAFVYFES